jgi:uncharacterized protein YndB with AHSA1/START domain
MVVPAHAQWGNAPDGPRLVVTRRFRQPIETVWAALTTPERIAAWMGVEWIGDDGPLRRGGRFDCHFTNTDMLNLGTVLVLDPPETFEHSWHENTPPPAIIRWALQREGAGCVLMLTHRAGPPEDGPRTAAGWTVLIEALANSLGEADAAHSGGIDAWRALRNRFGASFPPEACRDGRRTEIDGAPALRFERRLRHPAKAVWNALVDPKALARWLQADDVVVESRVGGRYHLVLGGGSSLVDGRVLRWAPPRLLEVTWPETAANGDSVVRFEIFDAADGSRLVLSHILKRGGDMFDFGSGWHWHLDALETVLDGAAVAFDMARWTQLRQAYAATL